MFSYGKVIMGACIKIKQKPNNIFPIFGSAKTGAKKSITDNQRLLPVMKYSMAELLSEETKEVGV